MLRLRTKNNEAKNWELKYPSKLTDLNKNIENYYEISDPDEIIHSILNLSNKYPLDNNKNKKNCKTVEDLVDRFELKSYAGINSIRKSYLIDELIRIDLDETDFSYRIGEIELILDENKTLENIADSIEKISNLTEKLGITNFDRIPGKISTYLYLFNPKLFEFLRKNAIINEKVVLNLKYLFKK